ncbi:hypothetical protein [Bittarella massiliensis (ex Durand et al. 2017)]|uniref:Uncharacterized protein n=1 Tax=Bittarella massiliensis (ex Durand et al. 2017) TaxID=1720313 RepID=A0AAW5KCZ7_9FIRM|nr:hypothetical protein [Bittarella massiliensis (ex Durand et al. 2017)]MCQ4950388.1 hypothetical protein [Bittarella massiliensis (ex Durand et al. 2017)]
MERTAFIFMKKVGAFLFVQLLGRGLPHRKRLQKGAIPRLKGLFSPQGKTKEIFAKNHI